jgi:hypothetical protein
MDSFRALSEYFRPIVPFGAEGIFAHSLKTRSGCRQNEAHRNCRVNITQLVDCLGNKPISGLYPFSQFKALEKTTYPNSTHRYF